MSIKHAIVHGALLCSALGAASITLANETPSRGVVDSRIRTVAYNADQVFHITGVFRSALQIHFGDNEAVTHVALGDTESWEVAPVGNILFLKPKRRAHDTNLIVLTSVMGQTRTYHFDLSSRGDAVSRQSGSVMFEVRFRYPEQERQLAALQQAFANEQVKAVREATVVKLALDHAVIEGVRNFDYEEEGASDLAPSEVSDNGEFTVMRFPGHQDLPAFFGVNPDGSETIIPYDVRDDFVVFHMTAKLFRLRRGAAVLCIYNNAALRNEGTRTGTASNVVERQVKENTDGK